MTHYYSVLTTPLGDFTIAVNESGAVTATAFGDLSALRPRLEKCHPMGDTPLVRAAWRTAVAREQIAAYFSGASRDFTLHLAPDGTPFQQRVWSALRAIPFGQTRSYGDLADELKSSPRAVGHANATNPVCLIVPCHRVIGTDGSLTGFAFGEEIKRRLLEHEGAFAACAA